MSDYDKETEWEKQQAIHEKKVAANTSAVTFIVEPPGLLEPSDERKRRGMHRVERRSKSNSPSVNTFVRMSMMEPGATWTGAGPKDGAADLYKNRLDWEKQAPRFLVQNPDLSNLPEGSSTENVEKIVLPLPMIDFWYDKQMYGKVDVNQMPVFLSETYLIGIQPGDFSVMAPSFVAHAWREFQTEWTRFFNNNIAVGGSGAVYDGGMFRPDSAGRIMIEEAWTSLHPLYHEHMSETFTKFQEWLLEDNRFRKVLTFKQWVRSLVRFLDNYAPNIFLTRSAFILSRKCPRAISGLQLTMKSGIDPNDDVVKKKDWLSDPNFELWMAKLSEFGFMVDFNMPWRVVADINSTPMRKYIRDYAAEGSWGDGHQSLSVPTLQAMAREKIAKAKVVNSTAESSSLLKQAEALSAQAVAAQTKNIDIMFKTCYYRSDHTDLMVLMNYILSWWNDYARAFPVQRTAIYKSGESDQTTMMERARATIPYDGKANPSIENLQDPYALLGGKSLYRASGDRSANSGPKSSYDIWVSTFGSDFLARFYLFVRAREAGVEWSQKRFDQNVKILREIQKNLDGKAALDYINTKTERLPSPGGNPPFRRVEHPSKTYYVYESRERELAGRGKFMIKV